MPNRRTFLQMLAVGLVATLIAIAPAIADELMGTVSSIDLEEQTFYVKEKAGAPNVAIKVSAATVAESPEGAVPNFTLERLKKGGQLTVIHENNVASKLVLKKGALKAKTARKKR